RLARRRAASEAVGRSTSSAWQRQCRVAISRFQPRAGTFMTESASAPSDPVSTEPAGDIVARGDLRFRLKWVGMGLLFLAGAGWFLRDGYIRWPHENEEIRAKAKSEGRPIPEKSLHSDTDLALQKVIGFGIIP